MVPIHSCEYYLEKKFSCACPGQCGSQVVGVLLCTTERSQIHSGKIVKLLDFYELERICDVRILENKNSDMISKEKNQEIYMSQIYKLA